MSLHWSPETTWENVLHPSVMPSWIGVGVSTGSGSSTSYHDLSGVQTAGALGRDGGLGSVRLAKQYCHHSLWQAAGSDSMS